MSIPKIHTLKRDDEKWERVHMRRMTRMSLDLADVLDGEKVKELNQLNLKIKKTLNHSILV